MFKHGRLPWLIAAMLPLLLLASCGGGSGSSAPPVETINPSDVTFRPYLLFSEKMSILAPEEWNWGGVGNQPEIVAAFSEKSESPVDPFLENVLIIKMDSMTDIADSGISNMQEISSRQTMVAGLPAEEIIFDADVEGAEYLHLRFMEIIFAFNESVYALVYSGEKRVFARNTEIVRYMAEHLKVGQVIIEELGARSDLQDPGKPAIASDGENFIVISCRDYPNRNELVGKILRSDRSMGEEFQIEGHLDSLRSCAYNHYGVIYDGVNYLVVYTTHLDRTWRVMGRRVTPEGYVLDADPIDVSRNDSSGTTQPDMVSDGNRTLVVWNGVTETSESIVGTFISPDGELSEPFTIADHLSDIYKDTNDDFFTTDVAYGNNQFMVVWSPYFFRDSYSDYGMPVYGQLVDLSGNILLPEAVEIRGDDGSNPRYVQVASDGTNFLVGWIEGNPDASDSLTGKYSVFARQIDSFGQLLNGPASTVGLQIAPPLNQSSYPYDEVPKDFLDLSFHDGNYLFLWSSINYSTESGVYGAKVSQDFLRISEPMPIAGTGRNAYAHQFAMPALPKAGHSRNQSLVVWPSLAVWPSASGAVEGWFVTPDLFPPEN